MVIGNRDDADLGVLGEWADGRGIELRTVNREDERLPSLDGCSLVVSLGSVWRVHDPALEPVLRPEQELLRRAVAGGTPVLAICFGMQQLTVAFGGEVYATDQPEIGFTFVEPRVAGHPARAVDGVPLRRLPSTARSGRAGRQRRTACRPTDWARRWPSSSTPRSTSPWSSAGRSRAQTSSRASGCPRPGWSRTRSRTPTTARVAALALFDGFWSRR